VPVALESDLLDAQGEELSRRHGSGTDRDEDEGASDEAGELGALADGRPQDENREADPADGRGLAAEGKPAKNDVEKAGHGRLAPSAAVGPEPD
jgi:hypothetical protein